MMKRLVMLLAVVSASVFAVSCEGLIDGFRDLIEDEMNDDESDGDDPMLEQGGTDLQYEAYDSYVELIKCSTSVIGEMTDERVITVLELAGITSETVFHYDGHGRPQSVSHYCIPHRLGLDRIETDYEFIYEPGNVSMVSRRKDYTEDGSLGYTYPDKIVNCVCSSEGIIEDMELSDGRKIRFYHDDDGYLNAAEVSAGTDVTSYSFLYDGMGRLVYIDPAPQFPESMNYVDNHHNANVDLNMFLLAHGIYDFNYDSSLLMILRMGGYLGYGLMNQCFIYSGSIGGVYYMSYPEE